MNKKIFIPITAASFLVLGSILFFNVRRSDISHDLRQTLTLGESNIVSQSSFTDQIRSFYEDREYLEVWLFNGDLSSEGEELISEIENSKYDGLQPTDYHLEEIYSFFEDVEDRNLDKLSADEMVSLELLLTDGFLNLAHDLENGKVAPSTLDPNWKFGVKETESDYMSLLAAVAEGEDIGEAFAQLYPNSDLYSQGREVIKSLYEIQKEDTLAWQIVPVSKSIKVGMRHAAIPELRERLIFWDFLAPYELDEPKMFDSTMFAGLQKYQQSNGMNPDGVIGSLVAESLNNSPQNLIDIASINMERLRWMPAIDWDQEMVLVNIANYQLDYMEKSDTTFTAKVIVGKEYSESPTFTAPMSYIVFSPYWNVPPSITMDEIIPAMQKNPDYLSLKNMEVVDSKGESVNAAKVNLSTESGYRVRQKPGGDNSLGLVKFMFPNEYNIYIHDTPARSLFDRETRALSHGCIRIQHPDQFAKILLENTSWTEEKILEAMHQDKEETVKLDRNIPVVLLYMTFWADKDGKANFRSDFYNRDVALLKALRSNELML